MSIDAASNKPEDIMDVNQDAVLQAFRECGASRLIHGHTHRPARHDTDAGERIVLGDWTTTGWCLRTTDQGLSLEQFPLA
jgi:UDP-2,3-diacylglucosamine hydrolase